MAVSQVNNTQNIVKLALAKKGIKTGQKQKLPEYLQMSGSIFKAPGLAQPQIVGMNTQKSIEDLNGNKQPVSQGTPTDSESQKSKGNQEPQYGTNASDGQRAMADAQNVKSDVEGQTKTTEKNTATVTKFAANASKLTKETTSDDKKFMSEVKVQQDQVKKDNAKIQKLIRENEDIEKELDTAQRQLEVYLGSSNGSEGASSSGNAGRTGELRAIIGAKVGMLQKNGKSIYSLQRSSSRSLRRMNKAQRNYVKAQQVKAKDVSNQQKETSGVLKVAQEVEKWSSVAQSSGQALGLLGKIFVAVGSSASWLGGLGAILVTLGTVMQKVGAVVELVGKYGQTAANITKTAAYAAEGNLMGAAMSAASAIQSGASAVKGTKELSGTFGKINDQAKAATEKMAAREAAKETVEQMKANGEKLPEGMTEKQATKYVQGDLQKQMQDGNLTTDKVGVKAKIDDLKQKAKDGFDIKDKNGKIIEANVTATKSFENARTAYENAENTAKNNLNIVSGGENGEKFVTNVLKKDGTAKTVSQGKLDRATNKAFKQSIADIGAKKMNMDWGGNITALGNSVTNIASVLATNDTMNNYKAGGKKKLAPAHLDARTRRIMEKNKRFRAIRNYAA